MRSTSGVRERTLPDLRECKIRASLLLKALRSGDHDRALAAADRFRAVPKFAALAPERILAWRDDLRRKHALAVIAMEEGFESWTELRSAAADENAPGRANVERLFDAGAVYLNHWCRTYDEARGILEQAGGYLFPYGSQFVVCPAGKLQAQGIDAFDPDWARIGFDWVRPTDRLAFRRLDARLTVILGGDDRDDPMTAR